MAVTLLDILNTFAPKAHPVYRQAFADPADLLGEHGITKPLRIAHFMAQCLHETGGFTILVESGRYSAKRLGEMWDAKTWRKYFANRDACMALGAQCAKDGGEALFNLVYGNRMGNGPPESGDGWRYRGRGIMQTTGRYSYRTLGDKVGVDFESDPELVIDPQHALKPALGEWASKHLNAAADHNDIEVITKAINGGYIGLAHRKAWFAKIWPHVIGGAPVELSKEWRVQEALKAKGYKLGTVDGVVGKNTRLAILAYRAERGLPGPPLITPDLLLHLGIN